MSDFIGGVQTRRLSVIAVILVVEGVGLAGVLLYVLIARDGPPGLEHLLPAVGAGAAGICALSAFYRALSIGTISIVAPVSATGAAVPVVVGIASGDHPAPAQVAGIAAALVGIVLASREASETEHDARRARTALLLALVAALGFGTFFVGLRATARVDVAWALIAARVPGLVVLGLIGWRVGTSLRLGRRTLAALAVAGLLDLSANGLYAVATRHGLLSIVAVAASLYPVTTVVLARVVLRERVRRVQEAGVVAALAGVILMAAG